MDNGPNEPVNTKHISSETVDQLEAPWILTIDNIFVDVTVEMPNNDFWNEINIAHGA